MAKRRQINPVRLKAAREKAGDGTKAAAAAAAGMTWQGYHLWETKTGLRAFEHNAFKALCDYLGVHEDEITDPVDLPSPALASA